MPSLHVCPLSRLSETVAATGASHLLTLVSSGMAVERPVAIAAAHHRVVSFSDIVQARADHVLPEAVHVHAILAFVQAWDARKPLVIHCYAGISRSPAAAYIAACALAPERDEADLARILRCLSPSATPNRRLVELADRILERDGRMVAGIAAIGRGVDAFEGAPFGLTLG